MTTSKQERTDFCRSLLGRVEAITDNSAGVSEKVNRTSRCDGYYEVLTKYDPETDLFNNYIPACRVERVAFVEAMDKVISKFVELFGKPETLNEK